MLHTLNVAQTGLKVSQTQVENVMNNIANENVDGYKKRVVNVSELNHADSRITGRGVWNEGVSRTTQIYMYQNLIKEEAKFGNLQELDNTLADIESIFKETDTAGLSVELNNYFKSIENLRTTPHSEIYQNDIINNANSVIQELQTIYTALEQKESSMVNNTRDYVDKVNSILKEIGEISEKISNEHYGSPNDLLDKRDALEKELAQYVDVEISRGEHYQLKIGGATAVRFSTNVHEVELVENYIPKLDIYAKHNSDGHTLSTGVNGDYISSFSLGRTDTDDDYTDGVDTDIKGEVQTIQINGTATGQVTFLGHIVASADGSAGHQTPAEIASDIDSDSANIINTWNTNHPDKEIDTISVSGSVVTVTYKTTEGDMPAVSNASSNGIDFTGSLESQKGLADSLTYTLDGTHTITVTIGETIKDAAGNVVDFDGSGTGEGGTGNVTHDNIIQALVYQINNHQDIGGKITAYNGKYELDSNGNKVLTSDSNHSRYSATNTVAGADGFADRYLVIEANVDGEEGKYVGELIVNEANATQNARTYEERNQYVSKDAIDDIHLEIYEKEINITGGSLKPLLDNVKTDSGNNLINNYKEKLDQFAQKLVDFTESYIENSDQTYVYGNTAVNQSYDADKAVSIDLFEGASVKTLKFNEIALNTMTQSKLDYLAELQWKDDIDFAGTGSYEQSFAEYYQTLRVKVADDREGVIFKVEAQEAVKESLQSNYDNIVKVDKDEELLELIKFQKAYEANAKIITVVDEMLETLLSLKR